MTTLPKSTVDKYRHRHYTETQSRMFDTLDEIEGAHENGHIRYLASLLSGKLHEAAQHNPCSMKLRNTIHKHYTTYARICDSVDADTKRKLVQRVKEACREQMYGR